MLHGVPELAPVERSIRMNEHTVTMVVSIFPIALIHVSCRICLPSFSILFVVLPVALIHRTVNVLFTAPSLTDILTSYPESNVACTFVIHYLVFSLLDLAKASFPFDISFQGLE